MEEVRKPDKRKEDGEERGTARSAKAPGKFKKWFLVSSAATLLAIAGPKCTSSTEDVYYPVPNEEQTDAGPDTDTDADSDMDAGPDTDADTDLDSGPDLDADTDADTDMDGGPDLDADTDADTDSGSDLDGGPDLDADTDADTDSGSDLDGGPDLDADTDADTDSGTDAGAVCTGVTNGALYTTLVMTGASKTVGGYVITNNGPDVSGGITVDIDCGSDSAIVATSLHLPVGVTIDYDVPADGKRISLTNINNNGTAASMTIVVSTL